MLRVSNCILLSIKNRLRIAKNFTQIMKDANLKVSQIKSLTKYDDEYYYQEYKVTSDVSINNYFLSSLLFSTTFQPSFRRTRESSLIILTVKFLLSMAIVPSFTAYEYSPAGTVVVPFGVPLREYCISSREKEMVL